MTAHQIGTVFERASGILLPRLVESTMMHLACSMGQCLSQHTITISTLPISPANNIQHLQVQSPRTEAPLSLMPIRALEVSAASLTLRVYVPTAASFIGDEGEIESICNLLDEERVFMDGGEAVGNGEGGTLEGGQSAGPVSGRFGEYQGLCRDDRGRSFERVLCGHTAVAMKYIAFVA